MINENLYEFHIMKNSRYSIIIVVRVILISINCFLLFWLFMYTSRPATTLFLLFGFLFQTISLIRYHNRILGDLSNFLVFLNEEDTTLAFPEKKVERNFKGLAKNLELLNQKLHNAKVKQEQQNQYLQAIVKQIDTGIIIFDGEGKIDLMNESARDILEIYRKQNVREIKVLYPELLPFLEPGSGNMISPVKVHAKGKEKVLSIKSTVLKMNDRILYLLSFQNIRTELEAGELNAWRKLIRIQRHEIINSVTPITTLTTAIKRIFNTRKEDHEISDEQIEDALQSVEVIEDRSLGLIDFVERFRSLTDVPVLKRESFKLDRFFGHLSILFRKDLDDKKAEFKTSVIPNDLSVFADEKLLEQGMINLIKNSLEAIHDPGGEIVVSARRMKDTAIIQVKDNGTGMDSNILENIFVPAFTTKENGSGIGLPITRQIIQMHQGLIEVRSAPGVGTVFEIVIPQ
jgi:two-component system, NtrC family, nitrogen regulation sensor histidine kinase NtrY